MAEDTPLLPLRMLNEVAYCPRLFALEWLEREWADNADTERGKNTHTRVDEESQGSLPSPDDGEGDDAPKVLRSVHLSDAELGLVGKIDLCEVEGQRVTPVDYKKGHTPRTESGAWEPERVQVCGQALLLRAHGYQVEHGVLYFAGSRRRVAVELDDELVTATLRWRDEARRIAACDRLPPPLVDSPKCPRCSLVGICLPDEHNLLDGHGEVVRPLVPARDDGLPLYVRLQGGFLGMDHGEIVVKEKRAPVGRARMEDTSRVAVLGNVTVSTPLLHELARRRIPVSFHSYGGWLAGTFVPASGVGVMARIAQHRVAADPEGALALARAFVHSKIANCRVLLRRNGRDVPDKALGHLAAFAEDAERATSLDSLLGIEGNAARLYFEHFSLMLKGDLAEHFRLEGRNRRPPRDPVNALLSFAYACLARELSQTVSAVGLDAYVGFLHQPRFGRPALALDLMEEFRPVIADSVVVGAINNGVVQPEDFLVRTTGVSLRDAGRRSFIQAFERRMDELATHAVFGTRISYRRILEVQVRLLSRVLRGELDRFPEYRIR